VEKSLDTAANQKTLYPNKKTHNNIIDLIKTTNNNSPINLIINIDKINHIFRKISELGILSDIGTYANADISFKQNNMLISGLIKHDNDTSKLIFYLKNLKPYQNELIKILPLNIYSLLYVSYDSYDSISSFFTNKNDSQYMLTSFFSNETAFLTTLNDNNNYDKYLIYNIKNVEETTKYLETIAIKNSNNNYRNYKIEKIPNLFQKKYLNSNDIWCSFINNYLIIAETEKAIYNIIDSYEDDFLLVTDNNFKKLTENLTSKANVFIFLNKNLSSKLLSSLSDYFNLDIHINTNLSNIGIQLIQEKNLFYSNAFLQYNNNEKQEITKSKINAKWTIDLDTNIIFIKALQNKKNNKTDIIIQDNNNTIYMIDEQGNILWKKQLDNTIIDNISQIDYYNNNRWQLLFTTKDKIHLIDRKGRYINKYPINSKTDIISTPLTIKNIDNKSYNYILLKNDNTIYIYTKKGIIKSQIPLHKELKMNWIYAFHRNY